MNQEDEMQCQVAYVIIIHDSVEALWMLLFWVESNCNGHATLYSICRTLLLLLHTAWTKDKYIPSKSVVCASLGVHKSFEILPKDLFIAKIGSALIFPTWWDSFIKYKLASRESQVSLSLKRCTDLYAIHTVAFCSLWMPGMRSGP
jgi:hypothetical protein